MNPTQNPAVQVQHTAGETMLYTASGAEVHVLNVTAGHIWHLCDGSHTIAQITQSLRDTFDVPQDFDLDGGVRRMLAELSNKGLLSH